MAAFLVDPNRRVRLQPPLSGEDIVAMVKIGADEISRAVGSYTVVHVFKQRVTRQKAEGTSEPHLKVGRAGEYDLGLTIRGSKWVSAPIIGAIGLRTAIDPEASAFGGLALGPFLNDDIKPVYPYLDALTPEEAPYGYFGWVFADKSASDDHLTAVTQSLRELFQSNEVSPK